MDDLLAGLLRGEALDHRALKASGALAIHDAALVHDILPLVADRLAFAPELPVDLRESFMEDAHRAAAVDLAADLELRRLLEAFAAGGVRLLLIKGSHLAYTHFDRPDLRARIDSDVLISLDDRGVADAIITTELGYTAPAKPSGDFTATQKLYVKTENAADVHIVDLHWRLTSPQAFAHVLSFEELYASSVAVPALGRWARGPSNVHALVIACMHRVAHHHDEADQFKWLYDIHLLASGLAEEGIGMRSRGSCSSARSRRSVWRVSSAARAGFTRWSRRGSRRTAASLRRVCTRRPRRSCACVRKRARCSTMCAHWDRGGTVRRWSASISFPRQTT